MTHQPRARDWPKLAQRLTRLDSATLYEEDRTYPPNYMFDSEEDVAQAAYTALRRVLSSTEASYTRWRAANAANDPCAALYGVETRRLRRLVYDLLKVWGAAEPDDYLSDELADGLHLFTWDVE